MDKKERFNVIKDPFVVEKILIDNYSHLAKWYRVESWEFDRYCLSVNFTLSSLDEKEFGRMYIVLNYNISDIKNFIQKTLRVTGYHYDELNKCLIYVSAFKEEICSNISYYLSQYSRDYKIEQLLDS